jgi:hypothetical protein
VDELGGYGVLGLLLLLIVESILSIAWQPLYFRIGIPAFSKKARLTSPPLLAEDLLNAQFDDKNLPPLRFKQLSNNEIAFRPAVFSFRLIAYTPVLHGLIRYDENSRELRVLGLLNWFPILFTVGLLVAIWHPVFFFDIVGSIMFTLFLAVLVTVLYALDAGRYSNVFRVLINQDIGASPN